jgi:hypothetical protein
LLLHLLRPLLLFRLSGLLHLLVTPRPFQLVQWLGTSADSHSEAATSSTEPHGGTQEAEEAVTLSV